MDKHAIRIEIGKILDEQCHVCPFGGRTFNGKRAKLGARKSSVLVPECQSCPHYKKLRQLADQLMIKEEIKLKMTVEEYHQLKAEYKTDTKIALVKNVASQTLYNWKKKHENELKSAKNDTKTAENVTKSSESEKTANQEVQAKLSAKVKEQEKEISKFQADLIARRRQVEALVVDKKKLLVESEKLVAKVNDLKDEFEKEKQDLLKSTQNQADTIEHLQNELSKSTSEREHAKQQIKELNAAVSDHEAQIISLSNDKTDLESQLAYTGQDRDKYFNIAKTNGRQLQALEAYVLTILEPAK